MQNTKGDSNLKATGIVRKIDPVGRLTLPKELRRQYQLKEGDAVEIFTDKDMIILHFEETSPIHLIFTRVQGWPQRYRENFTLPRYQECRLFILDIFIGTISTPDSLYNSIN